MPVERSTGHSGKALIIAFLGVAAALGIAFGIAVLDSRGDVDIRPGTDEASFGDVEDAAESVASGGPLFHQDQAGGDRDVVIQHLGPGSEEGWLAIAARPGGTARECMITWQEEEEVFRLLDAGEVTDACDGREYPADGGDLPTFEVTIRDGRGYFDPRSDER